MCSQNRARLLEGNEHTDVVVFTISSILGEQHMPSRNTVKIVTHSEEEAQSPLHVRGRRASDRHAQSRGEGINDILDTGGRPLFTQWIH